MKAMRFAILAAAALIVAACLPVTTKNPVGTTMGFKSDPGLLGLWKGHGDDDTQDAYVAFLANDDGTMTALLISPDEKGSEWESYTIKTAALGDNHLMNVWGVLKNGKAVEEQEASTDILLAYRFEKDGKLTLSLLDEKATADAIKAGKIQGIVDPGNMGDVHITAEPAALDAFFASKEAATLFSEKLITFSKVE